VGGVQTKGKERWFFPQKAEHALGGLRPKPEAKVGVGRKPISFGGVKKNSGAE